MVFFIKDRRFKLDPKVATIIAQIACYKECLPQGSPCSPVISNLIGNILDVHMVKLASQEGCIYSRYADDLTFSTNKRSFPRGIAIQSEEASHRWNPGSKLLKLVRLSGFEINPKKTRMQYCYSRQEVTGLVVNEKPNIKHEYRHNVRAMAHHLFKKGEFFLPSYWDIDSQYKLGNITQLQGRLSFIYGIDKNNQNVVKNSTQDKEKKDESQKKLYRRFLFYKEFYIASKSVLICEGWTDYVYIKTALKQLANCYPSLVKRDDDGKFNFAIRCFKYARKNNGKIREISKILGINGGTGDFPRFLNLYKREFEHFSSPGMKEPVILLLDNDNAGRKVINNYSINLKDEYSQIHKGLNLYLVFTPLKGAEKSIIEDLFDDDTLGIKIEGKSFDKSNEDATSTTYGKAVFAKKVVQEMSSSINFDGFVPLLDRIVNVIQQYYSQRIEKT